MLLRFEPFRAFEQVARPSVRRPAMVPMDAYRRGDEVVVHLDVPGVDPETIDVTVERNSLTVRAERSWQPAGGAEVLASERPHGRFTRQLVLGDGLALDAVSADYDHGVLTITVPVAEQAKPRKVEIGNGRVGAIEATSTAS
jgi:HSP20 family protein